MEQLMLAEDVVLVEPIIAMVVEDLVAEAVLELLVALTQVVVAVEEMIVMQ
jgi:hypothetical protein